MKKSFVVRSVLTPAFYNWVFVATLLVSLIQGRAASGLVDASFNGGDGNLLSVTLPRGVTVEINQAVTTSSLSLVFLNAYSSPPLGGGQPMRGLRMRNNQDLDVECSGFGIGIPAGTHNYREFYIGFSFPEPKTFSPGDVLFVAAGVGISESPALPGLEIPDSLGPFVPEIIDMFGNPISATITADVGSEYSPFVSDIDLVQVAQMPTSEANSPFPRSAASAVVATDGFAYVWDRDEGLKVVDIADPTRPTIIERIDDSGTADFIILREELLYVYGNFLGFRIFDVGNPSNPLVLVHEDDFTFYQGIDFSGDSMIVSDGQYLGLRVFDVTDPTARTLVGEVRSDTVATPGPVVVNGERAYMVDGNGFTIYDISEPSDPTFVNHMSAGNSPDAIGISGSLLILSGGTPELHVFDISDADAPLLVSSLNEPLAPGFSGAPQYSQSHGLTYITGSSSFHAGLFVYDLSNPLVPILSGRYEHVKRDIFQEKRYGFADIAFVGDHVLAVSGDEGLIVLRKTKATLPRSGNLPLEKPALAAAVDDSSAALAKGFDGLEVIDLTNKAEPIQMSSLEVQGKVNDVDFQENIIYVANLGYSLQIFAFDQVEGIQQIGGVDLGAGAVGLDAVGDTCFVAIGSGGLKTVNISNPESAFEIGSVDTPGNALDVVVNADLALVADDRSGVQIVDVSLRHSPAIIGNYRTPIAVSSADFYQSYAVVVDAQNGMILLDIEEPSQPEFVSKIEIQGYAWSAEVVGDSAYIASDNSGIEIIDLRNPRRPVRIGGTSSLMCRALASTDAFIIGTGLTTGVSLFDPMSPPPILSEVLITESDHVQFIVSGTIDEVVTVEASNDLRNWTPIDTITLTNQAHPILELLQESHPRRYYRAKTE